MGKVFLIVPNGVNVHVDVGIVRKLDLVNLRIFLGHDDVHHRYVRDGRPVTHLTTTNNFTLTINSNYNSVVL